MNIKYRGEIRKVRRLSTTPGRFKLGDIVMGPDGILLEVKTVQRHCPIWESTNRSKCVVIFETESGACVPVHNIQGHFTLFRR